MPLEKLDAPAVQIFGQENILIGPLNPITLYEYLRDQVEQTAAVDKSFTTIL